MRNPTRRNRNIGTAKQGYGQDNRLCIPGSWRDFQIFYEKLNSPVRFTRTVCGKEIAFLVEGTLDDYRHFCTVDDIYRMLEYIPKSDLESELVELVLRNAEEKLLIEVKGGDSFPKALIELRELLGLDEVPMRIEGIDVSNIGGDDAVGAVVTFSHGKADKKGYRRYRIKTVTGIDDYAMIREVVRRRYEYIVREGKMRPDLLLIDGGIGHLGSAVEELEILGIDLPVISIAKKREELYVPGESKPLNLEDNSEALRLIKKVRDEAHRFAISYHKVLRIKKAKKSVLNEIRGVGEVKRTRLMNRFGSIEKMRKASVEELAETPLVSKSLAQRIHEFLKQEKR